MEATPFTREDKTQAWVLSHDFLGSGYAAEITGACSTYRLRREFLRREGWKQGAAKIYDRGYPSPDPFTPSASFQAARIIETAPQGGPRAFWLLPRQDSTPLEVSKEELEAMALHFARDEDLECSPGTALLEWAAGKLEKQEEARKEDEDLAVFALTLIEGGLEDEDEDEDFDAFITEIASAI